MGIGYGTVSKRIGVADIHSVNPINMTITAEGEDLRGGYYVSAYVNTNAPGCGNPIEPTIQLNIKTDSLPGWRRISFKTYGTFTAACWNLNEGVWANNLHSYATGSGDMIFKSVNCFELPQFTVKTSACDNDSTNAFHPNFDVGSFRIWYQTRRRNNLTLPAGPSVNLSCNGVGENNAITFSDIFVLL